MRLSQIKLDFDRDKSLYINNYLSKKEFEESTLKHKTILNEIHKLPIIHKSRWENERNELILRENSLVRDSQVNWIFILLIQQLLHLFRVYFKESEIIIKANFAQEGVFFAE